MKPSLRELYDAHQGKLSDKWASCLSAYDVILKPYRDQPVNLLEIGIQNGGSFEIWSEYFVHAQKLVGCDINPKCAQLSYEDPRIKVVVGDANAPDIEAQVLSHSPAFDIVLDDGSHKSSDIIKFFSRYFAHLKDGGVYIVEDLHCSYWQNWGGGLYDPHSAIAFFKLLADAINREHWGIAKECAELFKDFAALKDFSLTDDLLAHVHSVEFANSLCIVRKKEPEANRLGVRLIVGIVEQVSSGNKAYHQTALSSPDESGNPWQQQSLEDMVAERDRQIANLDQAIAERNAQLAERDGQLAERDGRIAGLEQDRTEKDAQLHKLLNDIEAIKRSTSWRITAPYRMVGRNLRQVRYLLYVCHVGLKYHNRIRDKIAEVFRREGFRGFLRRLCWLWKSEGVGSFSARLQQLHAANATSPQPASSDTAGVVAFPSIADLAITRTDDGKYSFSQTKKGYVYIAPQQPADLDVQIEALRNHAEFAIVVPVYNTPENLLDKMLDSVYRQWYPYWQLILVNDASPNEATRAALAQIDDPRVIVVRLDSNKGISGATNVGIEKTTAEFIVFVDHDDELTEDCLFELALCISRNDPDFIYSDEDKITENGDYTEPHFKPDWSPDTMMSTMYTCHVSCVRRSLIETVGGLRSEFDGCQDWDFVLRVAEHTQRISHIPKVLYHWRIIPASTASDISAKPYVLEASQRVRSDALARRGLRGKVEPIIQIQGYFRVAYDLQENPLISIVIPTKDNADLLRRCIDSVLGRTRYRRFEIVILDNGSTAPDTLAFLRELDGRENIKVVRHDAPFNFSELNNIGVRYATGELLLFLNDDTEVVQDDWLERLGGFAQLSHIGAVGAKLLYPDGKSVQHVGIVNLEDGPNHVFLKQHCDAPCYFMRNLLEYNWLAVTGACLMIERFKFESINGFAECLPVAYNDIDLCMRLVDSGYFNVVVSAVTLIHHESATRGLDCHDPVKAKRLKTEQALLYERNPRYYQYDPFHNPNFHPNGINFEVPA